MTIPSNLQAEESGTREHQRLCHSEAVSQEILKRTGSPRETLDERVLLMEKKQTKKQNQDHFLFQSV